MDDELRSRWDRLVRAVVAALEANGIDALALQANFERRTLSLPGSWAEGRWTLEVADEDLLHLQDFTAFAGDVVLVYRRGRDGA
jgi:hypothetical protein